MLIPAFLFSFLLSFEEIPKFSDIILFQSNSNIISVDNFSSFSVLNLSQSSVQVYSLNFEKNFSKNHTTTISNMFAHEKREEPMLIFIEVNSLATNDNNYSATATAEQGVFYPLLGMLNNNGTASPAGIPKNPKHEPKFFPSTPIHHWIYFIHCSPSPSSILSKNDTSTDIRSIKSFLSKNVPNSFQLNSHIYFVTCQSIFEAYYFRGKLVMRKIFPISNFALSTTVRRRDFMGELLHAAMARNQQIISTNNSFNSPSVQLFIYMQDLLNFTIKYQPNRNWDGMIYKLATRNTDIGLSATGMIWSTAEHFRFLNIPTYTDMTMAYYSKPDQTIAVGASIFVHVRPFDSHSWIGVGVTAGILFMCYFVMSGQPLKTLCWEISCLTLRGHPHDDQCASTSIRIVSVVGSLFGLVLYTIYSGQLISALSTNTEHAFSLVELIGEGFTFGIVNDSFLHSANEADDYPSNSIAAKVLKNLHPAMGQTDINTGIINTLRHENFAFLTEDSVYELIDRHVHFHRDEEYLSSLRQRAKPLCEYFRSTPIPEYTVKQGPLTRKDSPLVNHFNFARIRSMEHGIWFHVQKRRELTIRSLTPQCDSKKALSFDIPDVLLPLYILLIAFLVSPSCLLLEILHFKFSRALDPFREQQRNQQNCGHQN